MGYNGTKINVGILGTGNIGSDLLYKVLRSPVLQCGIFIGRNKDSEGIKRAQAMGVRTSFDSIKTLVDTPSLCDIVFDTTTAEYHAEHAAVLKKLGKFTIDLTPSRIGSFCVPAINLEESLEASNVNLVTCGGQTLIPIAKAVMDTHPDTSYIEIVGSIASKSAGPGTRANIEEYIQTTTAALKNFSGVPKAKAILILNPAEPPILMHNTMYALIPNPDIPRLKEKIESVVRGIQTYVPGYRLAMGPVLERGRVSLTVEVVGRGDFLPTFAGNLDIITCAAIRVAEAYAQKKIHMQAPAYV
ncbi:MAG TPA: acetaldehyde dehydrogenase (acetylating) [Candidatus Kapabacteria bacterium]|nr:acetaldehyde dehydrogenase (acetylating) [Candidatus Kapabacteria bacterium]